MKSTGYNPNRPSLRRSIRGTLAGLGIAALGVLYALWCIGTGTVYMVTDSLISCGLVVIGMSVIGVTWWKLMCYKLGDLWLLLSDKLHDMRRRHQ
jgi:hypothetical protein